MPAGFFVMHAPWLRSVPTVLDIFMMFSELPCIQEMYRNAKIEWNRIERNSTKCEHAQFSSRVVVLVQSWHVGERERKNRA